MEQILFSLLHGVIVGYPAFCLVVQVRNGVSGRLFFFVLSHSLTNFKFDPRYANISRSVWDLTKEWLLMEQREQCNETTVTVDIGLDHFMNGTN